MTVGRMRGFAGRGRGSGLAGTRRISIALAFMLLAFSITHNAVARPMKAANSYVIFDLPDSFLPQDRYAGFFSKQLGATIMVLDLPHNAYEQFTSGFSTELEKKGYRAVKRSKLSGRRGKHLFFHAEQQTPVGLFSKYLLIFKNKQRAAYVTITINPVEKTPTPLSDKKAKSILAGAKLSNQPAAQPARYRLDYVGPFKKRDTLVGSTTLYILKKQQNNLPTNRKTKGKPMFVIAPSLSRSIVKDIVATGRDLMQKFKRFKNMKLLAEEELVVDGMKAYGISGQAINKSNDEAIGVYQLILVNPKGGYHRLVGVAPKASFTHYLNEFRHMAASFHLSPGE